MIKFNQIAGTGINTHLENGAMQGQSFYNKGQNILLSGYHYTNQGWINFTKGWHNQNTLEFITPLTTGEQEEINNMLMF